MAGNEYSWILGLQVMEVYQTKPVSQEASKMKIIFVGMLLPIIMLPLCVFVASLLMPHSNMDPEFRNWLPIVLPMIALSYSLPLAFLVVFVNLHLLFRKGCTTIVALVFGMFPLLVIMIVVAILFRFLPEPMVQGAEMIWTAL